MTKLDSRLIEILIEKANFVMDNAYAPYSQFKVGCALSTPDESIFVGSNCENATYALVGHAETSAIGAMTSAGYREINHIVITSNSDQPCPPCGGCRQVINEFATVATRIHLAVANKIVHSFSIDTLLPYSFNKNNL